MSLMRGETNFQIAEILGYLGMVLAFVFIFLGIREYRDRHQGGNLSFGQGMRLGLGITLIASILYVACWMVLSNTIASDFGEQYYQQEIETIEHSDRPEAEKAADIAKMEKNKAMYMNPFVQAGVSFLEVFPVGLLITLVSALILQRKS